MSRDLLDYKAAAARLAVSPGKMRKLKESGEIGHVKIGALVRFRPEDLERYITRVYQAPVETERKVPCQ